MAKFYGKVGFMTTEKTAPGVYEEVIVEKEYYGDLLKVNRRWEGVSNHENDDLNVSLRVSILADDFAYEHLHEIRYVEWYNSKWKATTVEVEYPRLIISIGGVYNGDAQDES